MVAIGNHGLTSRNGSMPTVHVFAAGPSLRNVLAYDWSDRTTIGVNGVGLLGIRLDAWCSCDTMPPIVAEWAGTFSGREFCSCVNKKQFPFATECLHWGAFGPVKLAKVGEQGIYWHGSVAQMACELARTRYGADRIAVYGLDYGSPEHAYDSVDKSLKRSHDDWDMMLLEQTWDYVRQAYKQEGIRLVNANMDSGLQALPKVSQQAAYEEKF